MGKAILTMHMSLDGIVTGEDRWMNLSDEMLEEYIDYYKRIDRVVVGGNTYAHLADYWQRAERSSDSTLERAIARSINDIPKLVVSRSTKELIWRNSEQLRIDGEEAFVREMRALKQSAGTISVESGLGMWRLFLKHALFDDLWIFVHPAVAAKGERLFDGAATCALRLASSKTYGNGAVGLEYRRI